jgi:hypothetical protein
VSSWYTARSVARVECHGRGFIALWPADRRSSPGAAFCSPRHDVGAPPRRPPRALPARRCSRTSHSPGCVRGTVQTVHATSVLKLNLELHLVAGHRFLTYGPGSPNGGPSAGRRAGSFPQRTASRASSQRIGSSGMWLLANQMGGSRQMPGGRTRGQRQPRTARVVGNLSLDARALPGEVDLGLLSPPPEVMG